MAVANGIIPSVGHTGICFDNALAESFNATIKVELIHLHTWPTLSKVKKEVSTTSRCTTIASGRTAG
jgi:transposase InsO family protein